MCIALIAINQHPTYPLIVLSNRDEFYSRPTRAAHFWEFHPSVFAGQDSVAGGTWLGVNTQGHFGLVTNYRDPRGLRSDTLSRGMLVKNFLISNKSPEQYLLQVQAQKNHYNPFNLIVGSGDKSLYYSNQTHEMASLLTGIYGLSNHLLNTPWFKVQKLKKAFLRLAEHLAELNDPLEISTMLMPLLLDVSLAPDELLPQTGIPRALEKQLSAIFIHSPQYNYGTRNSTVLLRGENQLWFTEKAGLNVPKTISINLCEPRTHWF